MTVWPDLERFDLPLSSSDVTIVLEADRACEATRPAPTLADSAATGTIRNTESEPDPLTASFSNVPAEHTGENFTFRLTFSEDFGVSYRTLRDDAFTVSGGRRAQGQAPCPGPGPGARPLHRLHLPPTDGRGRAGPS